MSTNPQFPRPPEPLRPPGSRSHIVIISVLILAVIVLASGIAVWVGLRVLSHAVHVQVEESGTGKKEVSIKTPLGSLEVNKDLNESSLGLPIYPGATRVKDQDSAGEYRRSE